MAFFLVVILLGILSMRDDDKIRALSQVLDSTLVKASQLEMLGLRFVYGGSKRVQEQWFILHKQLGTSVKSLQQDDISNKTLLTQIQLDLDRLLELFHMIGSHKASYSEQASTKNSLSQRMIGQLITSTSSLTEKTKQLKRHQQQRYDAFLIKRQALVLTGFGIFLVLIIWLQGLFVNKLIKRLNRLNKAFIGYPEKHLNLKAVEYEKDELDELQGSFMRMFNTVEQGQLLLNQEIDKVRVSNQQLIMVIDGAKLGFWDWNWQTGEYLVNDQWLSMLGLDRADSNNYFNDWFELIHPEEKQQVKTLIEGQILAAKPFEIVFRIKHKKGRWKWVLSSGSGVTFNQENGEPIRICGIHQDITKRKQSEEKIHQLTHALKTMIEVNQAIIHAESEQSLLNNVCQIIYQVGDYRLAWIGYAEDDPDKKVRPVAHNGCDNHYVDSLGITWADTEKGRGPTGTAVRTGKTVIAQDIPSDIHFRPWRTQSLTNNFRSSIALPLMMNNKVFGALNIYAKVENAFNSEAVSLLNELAQHLSFGIQQQRNVIARGKAEKALQRSQKMEGIGNLTGGIAHDFNNLLGIVQGNLEILERELKGDEKLLKRVSKALSGVHRGTEITKQLLRFSRPKPVSSEPLSINNSIINMEALIDKSLLKKIQLQLFLADDLWLASLDEGDFQDSILNLIINARDAMPEGGRILIETANKVLDESYASTHPDIHPGEYVQISLSDNGCGMDTQTLEQAFEPFFSTKELSKGTGLGLSMVYGFVKRSHGTIQLYSELAHGTKVNMYFPRVLYAEQQQPIVTQDLILPKGDETILVVDDEIALLELAVDFLQKLGYQVLTAVNGQGALDVFAKQQGEVDVLFSDIIMPGELDGFRLAEQVHIDYPKVKILLTSGFADKAIKLSTLSKHNIVLLDKPYSQQDLAIEIRKVLSQGKSID